MFGVLNRFFIFWFFILCGSLKVLGQSAIDIRVSSNAFSGEVVSISGDNLIDLFDNVLGKEDELARFSGEPISAVVDYLGVPNSIQIEVSASGKNAVVSIPLTGLKVNFEGASASDLEKRIETYFRKEGSSEIARFRSEIAKRSKAAISDGNPSASTALLAQIQYRVVLAEQVGADRSLKGLSITSRYSDWNAGALEGEAYFLRLDLGKELGKRSKLLFSAPVEYRRIGSASIYGGSALAGVRFQLNPNSSESALHYSIAPFAGVTLRGSEDLAAGGALWTYGSTFVAEKAVSTKDRLAVLFQINGYDGIPIIYEGFELDSFIDQGIVKLGVSYTHGLTERLDFVTSLTRSQFVKAAAVKSFDEVHLGFDWEAGGRVSFSSRAELKRAEDFEEASVQFGVSW